jgi:hypothetical protein
MDFWMIRTFDHAGYYETRLILMAISLAVACYFAYYRLDRRFLLMFVSGVVLQTIIEYILQFRGLRTGVHTISIFGARIQPLIGPVIQGFTEGGSFAMFAFWFADLRSSHARFKRWAPLIALGAVIVILAFAAGVVARNQPISSARPMFASLPIFAITAVIFISLFIAWRKNALPGLANYYAGLLVFAILSYEPLHLLGARYIGVLSNPSSHPLIGLQGAPQFAIAPMPAQAIVMLLSHLYEAAGGKLHYFIIPLALGLLSLKEREDLVKRERYSTQHLLDLAQRGWRKKSKPFTR